MRADEIHEEVRALCTRLAAGLGVLEADVPVLQRAPVAAAPEEV
jgi:hypothetical protein